MQRSAGLIGGNGVIFWSCFSSGFGLKGMVEEAEEEEAIAREGRLY
jgi:hypothetical protein